MRMQLHAVHKWCVSSSTHVHTSVLHGATACTARSPTTGPAAGAHACRHACRDIRIAIAIDSDTCACMHCIHAAASCTQHATAGAGPVRPAVPSMVHVQQIN